MFVEMYCTCVMEATTFVSVKSSKGSSVLPGTFCACYILCLQNISPIVHLVLAELINTIAPYVLKSRVEMDWDPFFFRQGVTSSTGSLISILAHRDHSTRPVMHVTEFGMSV